MLPGTGMLPGGTTLASKLIPPAVVAAHAAAAARAASARQAASQAANQAACQAAAIQAAVARVAAAAAPPPPVFATEDTSDDAEHGEMQSMTMHLDEVPMLNRPSVPPSPTDREVFVDPLPSNFGHQGFAEWLKTFGDVEEVFRLPGQDRGYVLFRNADTAAKCVSAHAGSWSESERAVSGQPAHQEQGVQCAYPDSLIGRFIGEDGCHMRSMIALVGIKHLCVYGGVPSSRRILGDKRVHIVARGTAEQLAQVRAEVEKRLSEVHADLVGTMDNSTQQEVSARGLPTGWTLEEVEPLFSTQGELESIEFLKDEGRALVRFKTAGIAWRAAGMLDATDLSAHQGGKRLRCWLGRNFRAPPSIPAADVPNSGELGGGAKATSSGDGVGGPVGGGGCGNAKGGGRDHRDNPADGHGNSVFIGNVPNTSTQEELSMLCGRVGTVVAVQIAEDKKTGNRKGFAFCDYTDVAAAARAVSELNGMEYRQRKLVFAFKQKRSEGGSRATQKGGGRGKDNDELGQSGGGGRKRRRGDSASDRDDHGKGSATTAIQTSGGGTEGQKDETYCLGHETGGTDFGKSGHSQKAASESDNWKASGEMREQPRDHASMHGVCGKDGKFGNFGGRGGGNEERHGDLGHAGGSFPSRSEAYRGESNDPKEGSGDDRGDSAYRQGGREFGGGGGGIPRYGAVQSGGDLGDHRHEAKRRRIDHEGGGCGQTESTEVYSGDPDIDKQVELEAFVGKEGATVFVDNFPVDVGEENIREVLIRHGKIAALRLMTDKESQTFQGCCVCSYDCPSSARTAVETLNDTKVFGKYLRVIVVKDKSSAGGKDAWRPDGHHQRPSYQNSTSGDRQWSRTGPPPPPAPVSTTRPLQNAPPPPPARRNTPMPFATGNAEACRGNRPSTARSSRASSNASNEVRDSGSRRDAAEAEENQHEDEDDGSEAATLSSKAASFQVVPNVPPKEVPWPKTDNMGKYKGSKAGKGNVYGRSDDQNERASGANREGRGEEQNDQTGISAAFVDRPRPKPIGKGGISQTMSSFQDDTESSTVMQTVSKAPPVPRPGSIPNARHEAEPQHLWEADAVWQQSQGEGERNVTPWQSVDWHDGQTASWQGDASQINSIWQGQNQQGTKKAIVDDTWNSWTEGDGTGANACTEAPVNGSAKPQTMQDWWQDPDRQRF
eukprot:TRINITY_DN22384_c0_g1_i1.p1 TRINITY_DN22384_c0_g1~~TRINITY_DN22384_c0_g1_i1.p1  ORF type:complete len:1286 (-),score=240.08 TRINITY_DN22384_c0_g1_i1:115-3636(-)